MGVPNSRLTDIGSGHSSYPPTNLIEASSNVIIEDLPAARKGDALEPHGSPSPSPVHSRAVAKGSSTVIVNDRDAARIGDPINCGGLLVTGASTVISGG